MRMGYILVRLIACCTTLACSEDSALRCDVGTVQKGDVCSVAPHDAAISGSGGLNTGGAGVGGAGGVSVGTGGRFGGGAGNAGGAVGDAATASGGSTPSSGGSGGSTPSSGGAGSSGMGGADDASTPGSGGSGGSSGGAGGSSGSGGASTGGAGNPADAGTDGGPLATAPFDCGSRDVTGATQMSGTVSATATWSGVIHVTADLSIRNQAVITVLPGTKFIVAPGVHVEFGALGNDPTLIARGTPDAPITFCGEAGTPGYWSGLVFQSSVRPASVLRNVLIADAGSGQTTSDAALIVEAPVLLEGVQVRGSGGFGVRASTFGQASQKLIVTGSADAPLALTAAGAVELIPSGSELTGNTKDQIELLFIDSQTDVRFGDHGVPYHEGNDISLHGDVTFEEGVEYNIARTKGLRTDANLSVEGTAQAPVVFRSDTSGFGAAAIVSFRNASLRYTQFGGLGQYAVGTPRVPAVSISSNNPVTLDHVSFFSCVGIGLDLDAALSASSQAITINHVLGPPAFPSSAELGVRMRLSARALFSLPTDTTFPPPAQADNITVASSMNDVSGTIRNFGIPYFFENGLFISGASAVVADPGTTLMFAPYPKAGLTISAPASFQAVGTSTARIKFANQLTNGTWQGIDSTSPNVTLDFVDVTWGGFEGTSPVDPANIVARAPLSLSNANISNSGGWGLLKASSDSTDYSVTNTFTANPRGSIGTLP